ncbi:MAG: DUF423 domain-containing protein, partial [Myxococcales bacterium FL481]
MTPRRALTIGCVFAATAVVAGALGAHALADTLSAAQLEAWRTAALYQLAHAIALVALAQSRRWNPTLARGAALLAWGVVAFSGSIYALSLGGPRWLGPITPLGGMAW